MEESDFNNLMKSGEIKTEEVGSSNTPVTTEKEDLNSIEGYIPVLNTARRLKQDESTVPTHTPKNFLDQFYLYLNGGTRKMYVWINKAWLELASGVTDHGALTGLDDNDHGAVYYTETEIDNFAVKLTGNQSVAGVKTFTSFPVTPSSAPTTDYQTANKKYVDDNAGGLSLLYIDTTDTSNTPDTIGVQYDLKSYTIPANTIAAGEGLRITAIVKKFTGNGAWNGYLDIDFGGTVPTVEASNHCVAFTGAAAEEYYLQFTVFNAAASTSAQVMNGLISRDVNTPVNVFLRGEGFTNDTTGALTLKITTERVSGSADIIHCNQLLIEKIPA